jgi:hypothetical protein
MWRYERVEHSAYSLCILLCISYGGLSQGMPVEACLWKIRVLSECLKSHSLRGTHYRIMEL